jgi:hypothetical protein
MRRFYIRLIETRVAFSAIWQWPRSGKIRNGSLWPLGVAQRRSGSRTRQTATATTPQQHLWLRWDKKRNPLIRQEPNLPTSYHLWHRNSATSKTLNVILLPPQKKKFATTLRPAKTCVLYETTTSALGWLHGALLPLGFTVFILINKTTFWLRWHWHHQHHQHQNFVSAKLV